MSQPQEIKVRRSLDENAWDVREIFEALCEVVGLLLVAIVTRDPTRFVDAYFAANHFYTAAQVPVAHATRVTVTYVATRVTTFRR